jgi:hypothetical protein
MIFLTATQVFVSWSFAELRADGQHPKKRDQLTQHTIPWIHGSASATAILTKQVQKHPFQPAGGRHICPGQWRLVSRSILRKNLSAANNQTTTACDVVSSYLEVISNVVPKICALTNWVMVAAAARKARLDYNDTTKTMAAMDGNGSTDRAQRVKKRVKRVAARMQRSSFRLRL